MERFLPSVHAYVCLQVDLWEAPFAADVTRKRSNVIVHHVNGFGVAKSVDEADPTVPVNSAVPFKTSWTGQVLPTKGAGEGLVICVQTDVALEGCFAAEDLTALPALILQQAAADERQRIRWWRIRWVWECCLFTFRQLWACLLRGEVFRLRCNFRGVTTTWDELGAILEDCIFSPLPLLAIFPAWVVATSKFVSETSWVTFEPFTEIQAPALFEQMPSAVFF